ncbi:sensor domain-containing diguanylate cyclase [Paenibacillus alkalitolerans]|uniref:sensor domain-containing diguanylate cyclase n=1 Tax=Paenibacillus alkalitolerans TaxID=2799335 RepID=UPI001F369F06|nr:sensor domain-containing diguanylate cyclase [Paenibacillus alkalitolerans]
MIKDFSRVPDTAVAPEHDRINMERELNLYRQLQRHVRSLHSRRSGHGVLAGLADAIREACPGSGVNLFMTQDTISSEVPVKPLLFNHDGTDICTKAYMEVRMVLADETGSIIDKTGGTAAIVAVPLTGNQGVYGVVEVAGGDCPFTAEEIHFLSQLCETAGSAFENAKLYEQSNLLITELRLVNEITKRLNQSLRLHELFQFACTELIEAFQADFACILQLDPHSRLFVVQATNLPDLSGDTFSIDYGFAGVVYRTKEPVIISDYQIKSTVESKLMRHTGSRSLIAAPITVNSEAVGVILVAHGEENFFTYDNYKLLQLISDHFGLAIANAQLHSELNRMVITDNLTGLYSRRYLDEQVQQYQKRDAGGSLIVVDVDDFKLINDTYGHQVGDEVLKHVSSIVRSCIRDTDIPARWGGEELAIYLPQVPIQQGEAIAERIRSRVASETNPPVTVSCGLAEWKREDEKISVELLFYRADMALYSAKHCGKNQYKIG